MDKREGSSKGTVGSLEVVSKSLFVSCKELTKSTIFIASLQVSFKKNCKLNEVLLLELLLHRPERKMRQIRHIYIIF